MDLYFRPLACSMATRISLYEAGADARFIPIERKTKRTPDGQDYRRINPLGLVPTLRTDSGEVIAENAAILQYVADQLPAAHLAPTDALGRVRLRQWLSFIGTELHKTIFAPIFDPSSSDEVKAYALGKAPSRLAIPEAHLKDREFLLDAFSVADAYLVTVLGWTLATPVDLASFPVLKAYSKRLRQRPSVARAIAHERDLYAQEQARNSAA